MNPLPLIAIAAGAFILMKKGSGASSSSSSDDSVDDDADGGTDDGADDGAEGDLGQEETVPPPPAGTFGSGRTLGGLAPTTPDKENGAYCKTPAGETGLWALDTNLKCFKWWDDATFPQILESNIRSAMLENGLAASSASACPVFNPNTGNIYSSVIRNKCIAQGIIKTYTDDGLKRFPQVLFWWHPQVSPHNWGFKYDVAFEWQHRVYLKALDIFSKKICGV